MSNNEITTTAPKFTLQIHNDGSIAYKFVATVRVETREEAETLVASLPKKMKANIHAVIIDGKRLTGITISGDLRSKKNNDRNETGIARLALLVSTVEVEYQPRFGGNETLDEALALAGVTK